MDWASKLFNDGANLIESAEKMFNSSKGAFTNYTYMSRHSAQTPTSVDYNAGGKSRPNSYTVIEEGDDLAIYILNPGYTKENIDVSIKDNRIDVSFLRRGEVETEHSFKLSHGLPNYTNIKAHYENGTLKIIIQGVNTASKSVESRKVKVE